MTTDATPPVSDGGEGGGAPDPYDAIRQAGLDPDTVDWADLAAKAEYVDALTDPNRHFDTLESSLRQWGHLPEGSRLSDMFAGEEEEDDTPPWAQQQQQQTPEIVGYDSAGEPIFSQPPGMQQQPNFDPSQFAQQFEERLMKNVDKRIQDRTTAVQREQMAQTMIGDIEGQMESVTSKYNLTPDESSYLWGHVRAQLATMNDVQTLSQVRGMVDKAWQQIDGLTNARIARLTDPSKRPPMTSDQSGPPPTRESAPPGTDAFGGMMDETARRLGLSRETDY